MPLPDATPTRQSNAAYDRAPVAPPQDTGPPRISLLSLFAGMGTDRVAMERILRLSVDMLDAVSLMWHVCEVQLVWPRQE